MRLPDWLDNLIFNEMGAHYRPSYADMTNIDDNREKTLNYLGTYFPRSYAESYCIFTDFFQNNRTLFADKEELSIFDFGCGTGGEIIGLLTVLEECFPNLKQVRIVALDGNGEAILLYENVLNEYRARSKLSINSCPAHLHIDFYKLEVLDSVMSEKFDLIVSFKAICEFVTKQQFEEINPYEHIVKFLLKKMNRDGLLLFEDVTTHNNVGQEWLPKMMDKGLNAANCCVVARNDGYNKSYEITHSNKLNDKSKVAWRMVKRVEK